MYRPSHAHTFENVLIPLPGSHADVSVSQVWSLRHNLAQQRAMPHTVASPPERLRQHTLLPASDIYQFAMVLYETIFRVEPFSKDSPEVGIGSLDF